MKRQCIHLNQQMNKKSKLSFEFLVILKNKVKLLETLKRSSRLSRSISISITEAGLNITAVHKSEDVVCGNNVPIHILDYYSNNDSKLIDLDAMSIIKFLDSLPENQTLTICQHLNSNDIVFSTESRKFCFTILSVNQQLAPWKAEQWNGPTVSILVNQVWFNTLIESFFGSKLKNDFGIVIRKHFLMDDTEMTTVHFVHRKNSVVFILASDGSLVDPSQLNQKKVVEKTLDLFHGVYDIIWMYSLLRSKYTVNDAKNVQLSFSPGRDHSPCKFVDPFGMYFLLRQKTGGDNPETNFMPACFCSAPEFTYFDWIPKFFVDLEIGFT
jgi:hypothetical protein